MKRFHRIAAMAIFISLFFMIRGYSQQLNYKEVFGNHYQIAEDFITSNRWMADTLKSNGIDPCTGLAIIFPELIRYSSIRDIIETAALKSLYIQYGKNYADFSIGQFQMKPSFAEDIEKEYIRWKGHCIEGIDTTSCVASRKERIKRLNSTEGQVRYLCMFIKLMKRNLQQSTRLVKNEEVSLMAAAYNYGFRADIKTLKEISQKRFFYTGIIASETKFNYSDIAVDFSMKYCGM
ncbi:MAG TPA: hypothetical protein VFB97_04060 [Bacteroidales bacterium]|nr:hypothetical protein [Bacteroidales bacterium]